MDNQKVMCLVLLDLLAVFDMVDHGKPLNRLKNRFSIQSTALKWIDSYHTGRTQRVAIGDLGTDLGACFDSVMLTFGVPQVSVLGPIIIIQFIAGCNHIVLKF